jgi:FKBP-type peptidyl-prolyl cis-trans isomerase FklB
MKKTQTFSMILLVSGALLAANAFAQTPPTSGSAQAPSAKSQSSTAAPAVKPQSGAGTAAKKPSTASTAKPAAAPLTLKTNKEKASYAFGANLGRNLKKEGIELDPAIVARGFRDGSGEGKLLLTEDESKAAMMAYSEEVQKRVESANQKEGDAFLAANKVKPGVVTLPSGLQYKVLTAGTGPKPTATDTIICNYRGTLVNGTEFDASASHGGPATIPVGQVIKGWTEALQLMPVGSKWQLYVPPSLAYGNRQTGPIGPSSTLIFDVELVSIQEKAKEEAPKGPAKADAPAATSAPAQPQAAPKSASPAPAPSPKPPSL